VLRNLQSNPVLLWQGFHSKILGGFKGVAWSGEGFLQSYLDCKNKLQVMGSLPDCYPSFIFSFSKRIDFIPYNHASKLLGFPASAISCLCASVLPYVLPRLRAFVLPLIPLLHKFPKPNPNPLSAPLLFLPTLH